jgi:hypothetical protein
MQDGRCETAELVDTVQGLSSSLYLPEPGFYVHSTCL